MTEETIRIPYDVMSAAWRVVVDDIGFTDPGEIQVNYVKAVARAIMEDREKRAVANIKREQYS